MKKFILKVLVYFLIVGAITVYVNYEYMERDDSDRMGVRKFEDMPSSIMICNFGSSHGEKGFNYVDVEEKDLECFNFALSSQVATYDERIFDYYKDNISEGAVVFILASYFTFYGIDETEGEKFPEKNKRYYLILPPEMIKEFNLKTLFYVKYFPSLTAKDELIRTLLEIPEEPKESNWSKKASDIDVKKDAKKACNRHIFRNKFDENGNRIVNQKEVDALEHIINGCYEKRCTPILLTPPYLKEYTNRIKKKDPDFFDDFYGMVDKVVEETGVTYYDYGFDKRFRKKYDWFMNSDHLNEEGARQFVNILMDEVI